MAAFQATARKQPNYESKRIPNQCCFRQGHRGPLILPWQILPVRKVTVERHSPSNPNPFSKTVRPTAPSCHPPGSSLSRQSVADVVAGGVSRPPVKNPAHLRQGCRCRVRRPSISSPFMPYPRLLRAVATPHPAPSFGEPFSRRLFCMHTLRNLQAHTTLLGYFGASGLKRNSPLLRRQIRKFTTLAQDRPHPAYGLRTRANQIMGRFRNSCQARGECLPVMIGGVPGGKRHPIFGQ